MKSDIASEIGMHVFERAGLGKAPFTYAGFQRMVYSPAPGIFQPGGSCAYCATGITNAFILESADGKKFPVGCDCINKTGDKGLIKAYKSSPEVRAMNRQKAVDRDKRVVEEWNEIMANEDNVKVFEALKVKNYKGEEESWLSFAKRAWGWCGMAGHAKYLKVAKQLLNNQPAR